MVTLVVALLPESPRRIASKGSEAVEWSVQLPGAIASVVYFLQVRTCVVVFIFVHIIFVCALGYVACFVE